MTRAGEPDAQERSVTRAVRSIWRITAALGLTAAVACYALATRAATAPTAATAPGSDLDSILRGLARPAPASAPFIEARFSSLLTRPVVVSGELQYLGPGSLVRTVEKPHRERAEIRGNSVTLTRGDAAPQQFTLDQAPQMRGLVTSFSALLAGDVATLHGAFALDLHGDERAWTIGLTPLDPRVHASIRSILVTGSGGEPRCLTTFQANDDVDFMLLANAAHTSVPASPAKQWFEARCRATQAAAKE